MPPQIVTYYYCINPEDVGISAFVLLKGGHFTIHTFPQYGCYSADLLYDGFANADTFETLMKREFPCDSLFIKRVDRDEFDKNDMGRYQRADFGPHYMIKAKAEKVPTVDDFMDILDKFPYDVLMHPITRPCVLKDNIFSCKEVQENKYRLVMEKLFKGYSDVLILRGRKNAQRIVTQQNRNEDHKNWQDVIVAK